MMDFKYDIGNRMQQNLKEGQGRSKPQVLPAAPITLAAGVAFTMSF